MKLHIFACRFFFIADRMHPAIEQLSGDEEKSLAEKVKKLKDAKETARTIVAANLLRDLIALKELQEWE